MQPASHGCPRHARLRVGVGLAGLLFLVQLVPALGCSWLPVDHESAAPTDACDPTCPAPTECRRIRNAVAGSFFSVPGADLLMCTTPCARDHDCEASDRRAYCTLADVCARPCTTDADCPEMRCLAGTCARARVGSSPPSYTEPSVGSTMLAVGARWPYPLATCVAPDRVSASSSDATLIDTLVEREAEAVACAVVILEARAAGVASIEVRVDGAPIETWSADARPAALLTIAEVGLLFGTSLDRVDLQRANSQQTLTAVARTSDGVALATGSAVVWSLDDPTLGHVQTVIGDIAIVGIAASANGRTTLRARLGDIERAIPLELALP